MRRVASEPRPDAAALVEAEGLTYARERGPQGTDVPYWTEDAAYVLEAAEVEHLERVTQELHGMCLVATRRMASDPRTLHALGLPPDSGRALLASLDDREAWSLYGRFDLVHGAAGDDPKLLEYNADTPAGLVEAAVSQWSWLESVHPDRDQWNMLHERLVQAWQQHLPRGSVVHLAADDDEPLEDWTTVGYLADTVTEAGMHPVVISMTSIGFQQSQRAFVDCTDDQDQRYIGTIFKMYPWEWMLAEDLGRQVLEGGLRTRWLEPVHKVLTGSKALLVTLWEMFPDHPNLLPASFDAAGMADHVAKPVLGWEGAGIRVVRDGVETAAAPGHTAGQTEVFQQYVPLPDFDGNHPVLGTWVVNGHAAGLGVRESSGLITDTRARFLPHLIDAPRSDPDAVRQWLAQ